ncbi:MAG: hypothetical protein QM736_10670 [Vicinamibacterales bacterium]
MMTLSSSPLRTAVARLWQIDRPLTAAGLGFAALLPLALLGIVLDPRTIAGAPAWLKPAKFLASTAVYSLTLAAYFAWLPEWPRLRRSLSATTVAVFAVEIAIIAVQAARGTTSHFNVSTPTDAALFAVMGVGIVVQTVASVGVAWALVRQPFADTAMAFALRAGMIVTILGAASGGLMTSPTRAQLAAAQATGHMEAAGSHTVGAPDGGPGLPGVGWSREHGDLRVAHFVGLHAMQILPLLALVARRRVLHNPRRMHIASVSYAALFGILLLQALRGEALVAPGTATAALFAIWFVSTVVALLMTTRRHAADVMPTSAMVA